jgi:hypothetical protein
VGCVGCVFVCVVISSFSPIRHEMCVEGTISTANRREALGPETSCCRGTRPSFSICIVKLKSGLLVVCGWWLVCDRLYKTPQYFDSTCVRGRVRVAWQ